MTTPLVDLVNAEPADVRRQRTTVRALGVVSALLLVFGLVGLVTIETDKARAPEGTPLAIVFSAADKTLATSVRMKMTSEFNFGGRTGPAMTADGVADFGDNEMQMVMKAAGLFEMEMRSDGKDIFVKVPAEFAANSTGKEWISLSLAEAEKAAKDSPFSGLPGSSGPMSSADPGEVLEWLKSHDLVKDAQAVGRVTVQGVSTTQYRVTLDFGKLAEGMDAPDEAVAELDQASFLLDLYIDDDGLIRREAMRMGSDSASGGGGEESFSFSATVTVDFSDFGLDVDVDPPPADQVHRVKSLDEFEQMLSGGE